jgi:hypothetical protein
VSTVIEILKATEEVLLPGGRRILAAALERVVDADRSDRVISDIIRLVRPATLYVVEPSPDRHSAGEHEPQPDRSAGDHSAGEHGAQSESEIADLDARLAGMSTLLRVALRLMKS